MSLLRLRSPLKQLLQQLLPGWPDVPGHEGRFPFWVNFPSDLRADAGLDDGTVLSLDEPTEELYRQCLQIISEECWDGDLEYLPEREAQQRLDRLVCKIWLERDHMSIQDVPQQANAFIVEHRQPPWQWDVAWEIENLTVPADLRVAGVTFFAFAGDAADAWLRPLGDSAKPYSKNMIGKAFARTTVRAGSKDRAFERAGAKIDDALNVLRVALVSERFVGASRRLQRRGRIRMAREVGEPAERHWGSGIENEPFKLELTAAAIERLQPRCDALSYSFVHREQSRLMSRLSRAVLWIGSSLARTHPDDGLTDLCTALEAILTVEQDERKAEAIAARYLLLVLTVGDPSSATHPIELYGLYLLRNEIVHGSSRRVASPDDVTTLRTAARDVVDRTRILLIEQPEIRQHHQFLTTLNAPRTLERAIAAIEQYPRRNGDAVDVVDQRLRAWADPLTPIN